ncbi:MAG: nickel-type superoxide dismutase maturation protease [Chloroflexi bacterium]|nr:nickel-type superoxide dismutase maturation protease [Chloroflexota bacterium]
MEFNASGFHEKLLWLLRLRRRYRVTGASMLPALLKGDVVLVDPRAYRHHFPQPGDIVVARHPDPHQPKIIKRVSGVTADGRCHLRGDNPAHTTDFENVPLSQIIGRVTSRFS